MGLFSRRKKRFEAIYAKRYKGLDGNWYRSLSERDISFYLQKFGIKYQTENSIFPKERNFKYDWKIQYRDEQGKKHTLFVEFFGYSGKEYVKRKKEKIKFYKRRGYELISIEPSDLDDPERKLRKKLRKHWKYIIGNEILAKSSETNQDLGKQLETMETEELLDLQNQIQTILNSRRRYLPITIETIGQFNRILKHNAYVSILRYKEVTKGFTKKEEHEYVGIWNKSTCDEVEVILNQRKFDEKNKDLYSAKWIFNAKEGTILAYRRNSQDQKLNKHRSKFCVVDGSQIHQNPQFLREIPAKLAYELAKENSFRNSLN
ncbi:MAG: hypothetical protein EU530_04075 [Promethearchaeota archaeon]|nr:MAG: hypothetical protein EU530_04075 [Candidatus Lokiarchaeota archaeon]